MAGCGGGGGGGGGSPAVRPSPAPPAYQPILNPTVRLDGVTSILQIDEPPRLTRSSGTTSGELHSDSTGTVTSVRLVVSSPGASFEETFSPSAQQPIAGAANGGFYVQEKTASDGSLRSLVLLDPRTAGLSYSTLGVWTNEPPAAGAAPHAGIFIVGAQTRGTDIPTTGSATYNGLMGGIYADRQTVYAVGATARAVADFGSRSVMLNTTGTQRVDINAPAAIPVADAGLDITTRLVYPAGQNQLSSDSFSAGRLQAGEVNARFFGPSAEELGGTFFARNGTSQANSTEQMSGGFLLKKQ
jgi:hypothetical protein